VNLSHEELRRVLDDVEPSTLGARVQKVRQHDDLAVELELYGKEGVRRLLLVARANEARLHFLLEQREQSEAPGLFVMTGRKYLNGAKLVRVELHPRDRVVFLDFERHNESFRLVFECTGHHPNLFLCDGGLRILSQLGESHSRKRELLPGRRYQMPARPEREGRAHQAGLMRFLSSGEALHRDLAAHYAEIEARRAIDERARGVRWTLKGQLQHDARKLENVEADLKKAQRASDYQRWAQAIQDNLYRLRLPRGADVVHIPEADPPLSVPLDPVLSLKGNMEAYFRRAHRLGEGIPLIEGRLARTREGVEALSLDLARLDEARRSADLAVIDELAERYPPEAPPAQPQARRGKPIEREPFRRFESTSGAAILVGRSAKDNMRLTLRVANGRDLWFHCRDHQGSHVILRVERDREPEPGEVREAALLAAFHSRGRKERALDVTFTEVKHVRPLRGGPPGQVSVAKGRTVRVILTADRLRRFFPDREFPEYRTTRRKVKSAPRP
jgi:predicted ribosome quality control (RQC) complex YloA/Tae2 family protein